MHVTTTYTSNNNLGLVITGLTDSDAGTYTCTAMYSNSEYLVRSVTVNSFRKLPLLRFSLVWSEIVSIDASFSPAAFSSNNL